jgi:shikimate 5-dehydrogenase
MTITIERLKWILNDKELASYIHEKEQDYEDFNGEKLPWNVPKYTVAQVVAAIMDLEFDGGVITIDLEQDYNIEAIEDYLEDVKE